MSKAKDLFLRHDGFDDVCVFFSTFQERHASRQIPARLTRVPTAVPAEPLSPITYATAHQPSMGRPASRMSMSAPRIPTSVRTVAFVSMRWAPTTADARRNTLANTARRSICHAIPHPATMGALASRKEIPPTSAPACQVWLLFVVFKYVCFSVYV